MKNNSEATSKQLKFIEEICEVLDLENPNCKTKKEACQFIKENIDEYKDVIDNLKDVDYLEINGY